MELDFFLTKRFRGCLVTLRVTRAARSDPIIMRDAKAASHAPLVRRLFWMSCV